MKLRYGAMWAALIVYEGPHGAYPILAPETLAPTREGARRLAARLVAENPDGRRVVKTMQVGLVPELETKYRHTAGNHRRLERWQAAFFRRREQRAA